MQIRKVVKRKMNRQFSGTIQLDINSLGLSQLYLSSEKIASVEKWFRPDHMEDFSPLPVHDFGNDTYTLTDGHTRTYIAYRNGITVLPVFYDRDEIVTNPVGQMLYRADIDWCKRFGLSHIRHLEKRIVSGEAYRRLWIERCQRSYSLLTKTAPGERIHMQKLAPGLFLYGASEDLSTLFFENQGGELFQLKNRTFLEKEPEMQI